MLSTQRGHSIVVVVVAVIDVDVKVVLVPVEGIRVGLVVGTEAVGNIVGDVVGTDDAGDNDGNTVGADAVGSSDGVAVGSELGCGVVVWVGSGVQLPQDSGHASCTSSRPSAPRPLAEEQSREAHTLQEAPSSSMNPVLSAQLQRPHDSPQLASRIFRMLRVYSRILVARMQSNWDQSAQVNPRLSENPATSEQPCWDAKTMPIVVVVPTVVVVDVVVVSGVHLPQDNLQELKRLSMPSVIGEMI